MPHDLSGKHKSNYAQQSDYEVCAAQLEDQPFESRVLSNDQLTNGPQSEKKHDKSKQTKALRSSFLK